MRVTEGVEGRVAGWRAGEDDRGRAKEQRRAIGGGGGDVERGREGGGGEGGPGEAVEEGRGAGERAGPVRRGQSGRGRGGHEGLAEGFAEGREVRRRRRGGRGGVRAGPAVGAARVFRGPAHDGAHLVGAGRREGHGSTLATAPGHPLAVTSHCSSPAPMSPPELPSLLPPADAVPDSASPHPLPLHVLTSPSCHHPRADQCCGAQWQDH